MTAAAAAAAAAAATTTASTTILIQRILEESIHITMMMLCICSRKHGTKEQEKEV